MPTSLFSSSYTVKNWISSLTSLPNGIEWCLIALYLGLSSYLFDLKNGVLLNLGLGYFGRVVSNFTILCSLSLLSRRLLLRLFSVIFFELMLWSANVTSYNFLSFPKYLAKTGVFFYNLLLPYIDSWVPKLFSSYESSDWTPFEMSLPKGFAGGGYSLNWWSLVLKMGMLMGMGSFCQRRSNFWSNSWVAEFSVLKYCSILTVIIFFYFAFFLILFPTTMASCLLLLFSLILFYLFNVLLRRSYRCCSNFSCTYLAMWDFRNSWSYLSASFYYSFCFPLIVS